MDAVNSCRFHVAPGAHTVFLCERKTIFRWYWWWPILNPWYMLLLLKQYSGHPLGFDGECLHALFRVECAEEKETVIKFVRSEVSWEQTEAEADYTALSVWSSMPIIVQRYDLPKKIRFRLKFNQVSPLCALTLLYAFLLLLDTNWIKDAWDMAITIALGCYLVAITGYKIYKIAKQKSFDEINRATRITFKNVSTKRRKTKQRIDP